jgi:hypothetical protein
MNITPALYHNTAVYMWSFVMTKYGHGALFFPDGGVGLVLKRGCLLTLAYYTFPR